MFVQRDTAEPGRHRRPLPCRLFTNEWNPATKSAKMRVLHNFGREDHADKAVIERLAGSLCWLLDPGRARSSRGNVA